MYSYISENNFGPSKQISVLTGYMLKNHLVGNLDDLYTVEMQR